MGFLGLFRFVSRELEYKAQSKDSHISQKSPAKYCHCCDYSLHPFFQQAEASTMSAQLTRKIDSLKDDFNAAGNEVSDAQQKLETALTLSVKCTALLASIRGWLDKNEGFQLLAEDRVVTDADVNAIASKLFEMSKYKYSFVELNRYSSEHSHAFLIFFICNFILLLPCRTFLRLWTR